MIRPGFEADCRRCAHVMMCMSRKPIICAVCRHVYVEKVEMWLHDTISFSVDKGPVCPLVLRLPALLRDAEDVFLTNAASYVWGGVGSHGRLPNPALRLYSLNLGACSTCLSEWSSMLKKGYLFDNTELAQSPRPVQFTNGSFIRFMSAPLDFSTNAEEYIIHQKSKRPCFANGLVYRPHWKACPSRALPPRKRR